MAENKRVGITFKEDEKLAILDTIDKIRNKKFVNIYFFFDNRTQKWHIFHHTEQNGECQTGFEEGLFVILKTLDIKSYCIIIPQQDKIRVDRVFTNTGIYISNLDHNLGEN